MSPFGPRVALVSACLLWGLHAPDVRSQTDAGRPHYTQADWAMLPKWCIDSQDGLFGGPLYRDEYPNGRNQSPRADYWTSIFGRDFWHLHHYCRALYAEGRLQRGNLDPKQRIATINKVINEYRYVIDQSKPTMRLMPEIYYRLGLMYLRKTDRVAAAEAFLEARRLKPDYWPAYSAWAEELIRLRMLDEARALVQEGLKHSPDEPRLKDLLENLGADGHRKPAPG